MEEDATGVTYYRDSLNHFLEEFNGGKTEVHSLAHEEIISKLDDAGKTFHVLVLKSTMTIPYTSVFFELECGYWNAQAEKHLRTAMRSRGRSRTLPKRSDGNALIFSEPRVET